MNKTIEQKLIEIEKTENVRIIYCAESGSRAWGLASPDSDFDVRFVYVRQREHYLRLDKTPDVIEWQLDDTLDINGWDVKKLLALAYKSNPTVHEWRTSPIVYRNSSQWERASLVIDKYFDKRRCAMHYLSMARSNRATHLKGVGVRLKKYFYVLRPLLACRWVLDDATAPPMQFSLLADRYLLGDIKSAVDGIVLKKSLKSDWGECAHVAELDGFIEGELEVLGERVNALPESAARPWDELNALFLSLTEGI